MADIQLTVSPETLDTLICDVEKTKEEFEDFQTENTLEETMKVYVEEQIEQRKNILSYLGSLVS